MANNTMKAVLEHSHETMHGRKHPTNGVAKVIAMLVCDEGVRYTVAVRIAELALQERNEELGLEVYKYLAKRDGLCGNGYEMLGLALSLTEHEKEEILNKVRVR